MKTSRPVVWVSGLLVLVLLSAPGAAAAHLYEEDFNTKEYCDTLSTTAWWDTAAGELKLPDFELSVIGTPATPTYTLGVTLDGDYAYLACHTAGLQVMDISDPSNPVVLGTCGTPSSSFQVDVAGDVAYVADTWGGLRVIDVSDPTNPTEVGSYEPGELFDVAVAGDHAYVVVRNHGLVVLDVSDPANPVPVGFCPAPGGVTGIEVAGNHAYVACSYDAEIWIADISDPANPFPAGSYDAPGIYDSDLVVAGDHLYTALRPDGLLVLDISDPTDPTFEGFCATPDYATMLDVDGDYAYVTAGGTGTQSKLYQIDVTDPSNPTLEDTCPLPAHDGGSVAVAGEYAFVANLEQGLQVVRIAEPTAVSLSALQSTPSPAHGVAVAGDFAYVAAKESGLRVIDVTDPLNPAEVGDCPTPGLASYVALAGDLAYVIVHSVGLRVLDISDPAAPVIVGSVNTPGDAQVVAVAGDYAYVADGVAGVQVIDISDPTSPSVAGNCNTPGGCVFVTVSGNYAYVGDYTSGLQTVDISDPTSPFIAGTCPTSGRAGGVAVAGNHAYMADLDTGIKVIDITDPTSPVLVGSLVTPGSVCRVTLSGDRAFFGSSSPGAVYVVDVSAPAAPALLDTYLAPGHHVTDLWMAGDYLYAPCQSPGLAILEVFQRQFNSSGDAGQSLVLDGSDDAIERAHITTSQSESVGWELSADGGTNWEEVAPTGLWHTFAWPGMDLLWRSTHEYVGGGVNPTAADLRIVWQNNIVCDPDPEYLTVAAPTKTIAVDYLGGGSGPLYGYSLEFTWDGAVASTAPVSVLEGNLLSDEGSTFFFAGATGPNTIRVDSALLGEEPGVAGPGTMFTIEFTGLVQGTSDIDIAILNVRDSNNQPLSGFYEDDGLLIVDVQAPVITNTLIENLTLAHTDDYIKDGDTARVTATVTDDDPTFGIPNIVADLSGFGDGAAVNPDTYVGSVATWETTITSVACAPADGTVTVTVDATDPIGNPALQGSDTIIADNTPPTAITDLDAAPGHEQCDLSWTMGTDLYLDGVTVRRLDNAGEYPTYPLFVANWPAVGAFYPADETQGFEAYNGPLASATDAVVPRNIYYYQAFSYDIVRNYGAAATTARDPATNYWLGDVATAIGVWGYNGLVNDPDIDKLGGTYLATNPTGNDAECDVGPTVHPDGHRLGLPLPDAEVQFEDLMIFAMNYGRVGARVVPLLPDESTKALSLELAEVGVSEDGAVDVALRLEGNADQMKGLSTVIAFDPTELEFVSARLSDDMLSPLAPVFFWHGSGESTVQIDLAVLGTGVTVGGSGDVAVLTFRALGDGYALAFEDAILRGAGNEDLHAELEGCESKPVAPAAYSLGRNTPNPFNPRTTIAYAVPRESHVSIRVYDVTGRLVRTLVDGAVVPGRHEAVWHGRTDAGDEVGSGVYFCVMEASGFQASAKMLLLK